ncbi:protein disulfide-isomerase [Nitrosomonas eutropha C91]|uniref:Protein disulfide-isomerase n=1 Tax=Nitrosomonas eutropha (strain DSM 101675 / C91 / Nm57) TaxID=335283 RepID=Q0AGQ2_NITEC|nr:protein disulfide-isomerase [Nitrosomonas eutropha C91]
MPLDHLILIERSTSPVAIIWSASDCPYCRLLEKIS